MISLGKLEEITDLRSVWPHEAIDFTPWLAEQGIRVPDDFSVMGVDNLPESSQLPVPLTSVEFSGQEVGERAFLLLQEVLEGRYPGGITLSCRGRIVERASVRAGTESLPRTADPAEVRADF